MTAFQIRAARSDDLPACCDLLELLFDIEEDFSFDADKARRGLEMLLEPDDGHAVFVADIDGAAIGMVSVQTVISTAEGGTAALLEDIVVQREHQGKGIATALLGQVEDWCRERAIGRIQLLTDQDNTRALAFYRYKRWQRTQLIAVRRRLDS